MKYKTKIPEFYIAKRKSGEVIKRKISSSNDGAEAFRQVFDEETLEVNETFMVLFLNRANNTVGWTKVSSGGIVGTTVDIKMIMKIAVNSLASSVIICHNHPSGVLKPSVNDKNITKKIKNACEFFDITLLDHIILSEDSHYSFADEMEL